MMMNRTILCLLAVLVVVCALASANVRVMEGMTMPPTAYCKKTCGNPSFKTCDECTDFIKDCGDQGKYYGNNTMCNGKYDAGICVNLCDTKNK